MGWPNCSLMLLNVYMWVFFVFACMFCKSLKKDEIHIMSTFCCCLANREKKVKISKIERFHVVCGCTHKMSMPQWNGDPWQTSWIGHACALCAYSCVVSFDCFFSPKWKFVWPKTFSRFFNEQLLQHCIHTVLSMFDFLTSRNEWNIEFHVVDFIFRRTCAMNTKRLSIRPSVRPFVRLSICSMVCDFGSIRDQTNGQTHLMYYNEN